MTYTFTPGPAGQGTITFNAIPDFDPNKLVYIINTTRSVVLFDYGNPHLKHVNRNGNTITLMADSRTCLAGDTLDISYGGQDIDIGITQPLTDTQLRASAVAVAPNITRGSGAVDSNTTRVALGSDSPGINSLSSIDTKTPSLDNSKQPVIPSMTSGGNISAQTAATGTNWTAYSSQSCKQLTLSNQSGTTIEVRQGGTGVGLQIPTGSFYTFFGIANANQLEIRRVDTTNTQVTITARWET